MKNSFGEWVSVKDRMPESNMVHYICYCDNPDSGTYLITVCAFDYEYSVFYDLNGKTIASCVTHWMELPDLPE